MLHPVNSICFDLRIETFTSIRAETIFLTTKLQTKMKKFYGILLCLALMAFKNVQAQTPCDAITVTIIEPAAQSGAHNYYGVRVSLAQVFGDNITAIGFIHKDADENNNHDQPFTLTIPGGELSAETALNFYETNPTGGAGVTIASVTPCPSGGTQINGTELGDKHNQVVDYINSYDFTGKTQDDFLNDVFSYTTSIIDPSIPSSSRSGIWGYVQLCGKANPGDLQRSASLPYDSSLILLEQNGQIGSSSKAFLSSLVSETDGITDYNSFTTKINQLESGYDIGNLPESEKFVVQGLLSVFKQSGSYWNNYYASADNTENPQARFSLRIGCFICVAVHDLAGAAIGYIAGTCICAKLGVPNPWICGAVGAVSFGALYSWAAKVCPDICNRCRKPSSGSYPSWICHLPFLYWR